MHHTAGPGRAPLAAAGMQASLGFGQWTGFHTVPRRLQKEAGRGAGQSEQCPVQHIPEESCCCRRRVKPHMSACSVMLVAQHTRKPLQPTLHTACTATVALLPKLFYTAEAVAEGLTLGGFMTSAMQICPCTAGHRLMLQALVSSARTSLGRPMTSI